MTPSLLEVMQLLYVPKTGKENAQSRRAKRFFLLKIPQVLPDPSILYSTGLYVGTSEFNISLSQILCDKKITQILRLWVKI